MKYRTLGRTGFKVSEVSLGGAGLAGRDPERAQESATSIVRRAAELGINYIDTAPYYGKSEELLGPALAAVDHKFYVATKLGLVPKDFDYTSDSVLASIEHSLKRLGLDRLDVAQIHEVNHAGWERITPIRMGPSKGYARRKTGGCAIKLASLVAPFPCSPSWQRPMNSIPCSFIMITTRANKKRPRNSSPPPPPTTWASLRPPCWPEVSMSPASPSKTYWQR